ncbi:MAG: hypothetical protein IKL07_04645 [Clostridium sp.]|nr:hypothetical protein [Clostridium sp.]
MENYITVMKRVDPVYHTTKNRKLKGDVDSFLANTNLWQEALEKNKSKKLKQKGVAVCSCPYSADAMELDYEQVPYFDQKA